MKSGGRTLAIRYSLSVACVILATWLRLLLAPELGEQVPFVTYFPAVFVAALYGGFGPALLAVALSALTATHYFLPPDESWLPNNLAAWTALTLFTFFGVGVALLGHSRQKKSLQMQRERERFLVTLASIADAVVVTDPQGQITFLNGVAEQLTGTTREEAVGKPLSRVFRLMSEQDGRPLAASEVDELSQTQTTRPVNSTILIGKDGREHAIHESIAPLRGLDNQVSGTVLVFRDVSEQRILQMEQGRLAALVESSEDAILSQTFQGVATSWNSGAVRLFGFTAEEVIGRPLYETIVPLERKQELLDVLSRVREGNRVDHFTTERQHKNGQRIPIAVRISPIRDASGNVLGASAIDRDISRQREAERRRSARLAVTQVLAQERSIEKAMEEILAAVCSAVDLEIGCFWRVDPEPDELTCRQFWEQPNYEFEAFREATDRLVLQPGTSLPGRVWETREPIWVPDVATDPSFIRAEAAQQSGLHGGFACPIKVDEKFIGVFEFFSHEIQPPDEDLLEMMATIGGQIGQFIERQEAEQKLRRSEQELSEFFENAAVGLHWTSADGTILRVNRAELEMLGYPAEEYVGRPIAAFHQDKQVITDMLSRLATGEELQGREARMRCRDGSIKEVLIDSNVLWENGRFVHTRCFTRDITERKRMERSLRFLAEASTSLASLVDFKSTLQKVSRLAVPSFADWCVVDMADADGTLQRVAVAAGDPTKLDLAERLHRRYPPDPQARSGAMHVFRTGEPEWMERISEDVISRAARDSEHRRILAELGLRSYLCVPLKAKDKVLGVISFVAAESGRFYGPDDLAMAEDLAHRAAVAMENARLYQEVRDADRRKDEFLAMLAHELRNPLAPIRSGLDILSMDPSTDRRTIELMQDQVAHMVRLVDDLLDVSRIMRGKIELRRETVELSTLIEQSVQAVQPRVDSHQQELTLAIPKQPIWLDADPVRLVQVFENLVNNATKYTDPGGRIGLAVDRQDDEAVISIKDTGIGIDADLLPHVFDLFTQASRSLDRAQGGLGIGLTLVQRLIQMHGGTVSAQSEGIGRGSTFVVRLPIVREPVHPPPPDQSELHFPARRILVVDDNQGAAWMLSMLLGKLGDHQIEAAHDGAEALKKVESLRPEIVLLDIGLPGMDGYEVARAIRASKAHNDILLIALTGYGQEEDRRKSTEAGFDEHLVKPPSVDQMKDVLAHPKLNGANDR